MVFWAVTLCSSKPHGIITPKMVLFFVQMFVVIKPKFRMPNSYDFVTWVEISLVIHCYFVPTDESCHKNHRTFKSLNLEWKPKNACLCFFIFFRDYYDETTWCFCYFDNRCNGAASSVVSVSLLGMILYTLRLLWYVQHLGHFRSAPERIQWTFHRRWFFSPFSS